MLAIRNEGLAKFSYQKSTLRAVKLESAICILQVRAFYQLNIIRTGSDAGFTNSSFSGSLVSALSQFAFNIRSDLQINSQSQGFHESNRAEPRNSLWAKQKCDRFP